MSQKLIKNSLSPHQGNDDALAVLLRSGHINLSLEDHMGWNPQAPATL